LRYENNTGISLDKKVVYSYGFSEREMEVMKLLIEGKTNLEIGDSLCISVNTVKSHVKSIYRKTEVSNRVQLLHKIREST
jgi:DNA-binding CsgD family transcriptional regulator